LGSVLGYGAGKPTGDRIGRWDWNIYEGKQREKDYFYISIDPEIALEVIQEKATYKYQHNLKEVLYWRFPGNEKKIWDCFCNLGLGSWDKERIDIPISSLT